MAFIDNNTVHALPRLLEALARSGSSVEDVQWLIVTHVHLDHSAGTAQLLHACPNATAPARGVPEFLRQGPWHECSEESFSKRAAGCAHCVVRRASCPCCTASPPSRLGGSRRPCGRLVCIGLYTRGAFS